MSISATPIINSFVGGELSPHLDGRTDHEKYYAGCRRLENFIPRPHGSVYKRPGTRFIAAAARQGAPVRLMSFDFNATESQSYVLELGDGVMRFHTSSGTVLDGTTGAPCEIPTPWTGDMVWDVNHVQKADVLYLAHPDTAPRKLVRAAHDDWSLVELDTAWPGSGLTVEPDGGGAVTHGSAGAQVAVPQDTSFEVCHVVRGLDLDGAERFFLYKGAGVWPPGAARTLTFAASPSHDADEIEPVYSGGALQDAYWKIVDTADSRPTAWGPDGDGTAQWPAVVGLYEDRLVFGATRARPLTLWMSRTGAHEDFRLNTASFVDGVQEDPLDDDAIEITLSGSRVNPIRWIADQEELLVGTNAGELKVWSGLDGEGMTPAKVQRKRQSSHGSAPLPAEAVSGAVLFVSRGGRKLRQMAYDIASYKYASPELTLLAEHVTGPGIKDMAFAREPDGVLWVVRRDGVLAACTYLPEQEVTAWHRHVLGGGGRVESVTSIPGRGGDEVWLAVRRTVDGQARRYLERLDPPFDGGARHGGEAADAAGAFLVDCGLSNAAPLDTAVVDAATGRVRCTCRGLAVAEGDAVRVEGALGWEELHGVGFTAADVDVAEGAFSLMRDGAWFDGSSLPPLAGGGTCYRRIAGGVLRGLDHLEGESVSVLLDGAVLAPRTVQDGAVPLPRAGWKVHAGYAYGAVLQPMRLEVARATGTSQTKRKRIMGVTLRFRHTVGGRVCPGDDVADKYERILAHRVPARAGEPPALFSGDREVRFASGWERDGLFTVRQDDPLPMSIICCVPQMQGER